MTPNAAKDSISANCRSLIIRAREYLVWISSSLAFCLSQSLLYLELTSMSFLLLFLTAETRKTYRGLISDPKLVTRISEPAFPKEKADGIVDTSSSKEKEKITSSESPAISVAASNLEDVAKSQGKEIVSKELEIPDPGLDMLGIGNETLVGKKVPIDVGVVNGKSSKGKKRKLDDEDQEEDVEKLESIKKDGTKSNKKGKNAIGNGNDSSPISDPKSNQKQVGKKSSSPNKIPSSGIKDSLADLLARGPMGNVVNANGNGNENGEGKKKKKRRKISGSQLPN
ncbi:hypothetical protein L7F22_030689 [Adiantum nelumboides]|nr:hypothetical protein [Adiantum nelumboides]